MIYFQIQSLEPNEIFLLTNSSVLIYKITINSSALLQRIPVAKPIQMDLGSFKDLKFLAILRRGRVEIYRYRYCFEIGHNSENLLNVFFVFHFQILPFFCFYIFPNAEMFRAIIHKAFLH